jgi:hypothetical protein
LSAALISVDAFAGSESEKTVERTWGTAVEGQALSAMTEKAAYAPGERIILNVSFKNVGREDVKIVQTNPLALYHVSVLLPDGKPAPLTLFGKGTANCPIFARSVGTLRPGQETSATLPLSRLFDFTLSGKYTVSVQRGVWKDGAFSSTLKATSNKLEITIDNSLSQP